MNGAELLQNEYRLKGFTSQATLRDDNYPGALIVLLTRIQKKAFVLFVDTARQTDMIIKFGLPVICHAVNLKSMFGLSIGGLSAIIVKR